MKKKLRVQKTLIAEETLLGEGAILLIDKASVPLIDFLRSKYTEDPDCLSGDIEFLFSFDGTMPPEDSDDIVECYERLWKAIKMPGKKKTQQEKSK